MHLNGEGLINCCVVIVEEKCMPTKMVSVAESVGVCCVLGSGGAREGSLEQS